MQQLGNIFYSQAYYFTQFDKEPGHFNFLELSPVD